MFPCRLWEQLLPWLFDSGEEQHTCNKPGLLCPRQAHGTRAGRVAIGPVQGRAQPLRVRDFLKFYWFLLRERHTHIILIFHLFRHLLVGSCMCPEDQTYKLGILGWCSNQLSDPARVRVGDFCSRTFHAEKQHGSHKALRYPATQIKSAWRFDAYYTQFEVFP